MTKVLRIMFFLAGFALTTYACAGLQQGIDAFYKEDYETALQELQPLAEQGNVKAQQFLGSVYRGLQYRDEQAGDHAKALQDHSKALSWLTTAATHGDVDSERALGGMYRSDGNDADAIKWYLIAAQKGDPAAQGELGALYLALATNPEHPQTDLLAAALQWSTKAAQQSYAPAQTGLGSLYREGLGVPKDFGIALSWYRKAAEQLDFGALLKLKEMFDKGQGVPRNRVIADALFRFCINKERREAAADEPQPLSIDQELRPLEKGMTVAEINAAARLTAEMEKPDNLLKALDAYAAHPTVKELPYYASASGKDSLCSETEQVILACVTKTRMLSVCASKTAIDKDAYIQYRVEKNGRLEFEFPNSRETPAKTFSFEKGSGNIGGYEALQFKNGEYVYRITHDYDKFNMDEYSVTVSQNDKDKAPLLCLDKVIGDWFTEDSVKQFGLSSPSN